MTTRCACGAREVDGLPLPTAAVNPWHNRPGEIDCCEIHFMRQACEGMMLALRAERTDRDRLKASLSAAEREVERLAREDMRALTAEMAARQSAERARDEAVAELAGALRLLDEAKIPWTRTPAEPAARRCSVCGSARLAGAPGDETCLTCDHDMKEAP